MILLFYGLQMWVFILLYSLVLCSSEIGADKQINKYVTTLIDAKWKETPLVLEVAEYLSDESQDYFWGFVEEISTNSHLLPANGESRDK